MQQWTIKIASPPFSIFSLAAILVGIRDHRTLFWKRTIQVPFHQSLVQIGPMASEELIKMWKFKGRTTTTDDGRSVVTIVRWANNTVRLVFTSSCLLERSCLIYVIWVCLRIVVSNTYCVVFLICFIVLCTQCSQFLWVLHF